MTRHVAVIGLAAAVLSLAGCGQKGPPHAEQINWESGAPTTRAAAGSYGNLPEAPPPSRAKPSEQEVAAVKAVAADLDRRAKANDEAYFRKLMPGADAAAVADMVGRVRGVDLNATYAKHLVVNDAATGRLDYHSPSHFQVELGKAGGEWAVTRLWFCR
jgi:hypothetical protein